MNKLFSIQLSFLLAFLLILIFTFNGNIHFGNGLGDLVYLYLAAGMSIVNFVIILAYRQVLSKNKLISTVLSVINALVLIYMIYSFTFGRGLERPWDGTIFF